MYKDKTIGVVVPAYNEEGFVGDVIETIPSFVDRIYAIDDEATDGTWTEIVDTAARINELTDEDAVFTQRVVPIQHRQNRGVGGAIKTGYLRARRDGIDVTAVMGGDGQMDPDQLERVIEPVATGEAAYAKGNRMIEPENHAEMPRFRYVGSVILTYLTKIASGYWGIGDPQMGYTAISLEALHEAGIEDIYEFYGYCNDLLVRLSANELRVVDVSMPVTYGDETSHISYRSYIPRVSLMLLRTFLWRISTRRNAHTERVRSGLFFGGALLVAYGLLSAVRTKGRGSSVGVGVLLLLGGMISDAILSREKTGRIDD